MAGRITKAEQQLCRAEERCALAEQQPAAEDAGQRRLELQLRLRAD